MLIEIVGVVVLTLRRGVRKSGRADRDGSCGGRGN